MNKIIVIGCPGAGKSTFSKVLSAKLKLPLIHLDMLFWNKDKTTVSREEFNRRLAEAIKGDKWILDGNYGRTLDLRLNACDMVFLLDMPVELCLKGATERIGKPREDMPWQETELDPEFRDWIINFPKNELPQIYAKLKKRKNKPLVVFHSHKEINDYVEKL